jgi:hypothetical protein
VEAIGGQHDHDIVCAMMRSALWILLSGLLSAPAWSSDAAAPERSPSVDSDEEPIREVEPATAEIEWLEDTRKGVYDLSHWLVSGVDSWFGDKPFDESGGRVSGRVFFRLLERQDDGLDVDLRYRLRVDMPNVSERAAIIIGREDESDLVSGRQGDFEQGQLVRSDSQTQDSTFFVGLGFLLRENLSFRVGVRSGYRLFAQARFSRTFSPTEATAFDFSQTFFAAVKDGVGTTTGLNYRQVITDRTAFRWRNSFTYSTETNGVEWRSTPEVIRDLGRQRQLFIDLPAEGETGSSVDVAEYGIRARYRQPVYKDWLFGELILGHFWPRDEEDPARRESWAVGAALELFF